MRVISGKYRNRKLVTLPGLDTRPTTARVKEDMFNILNNYFIFENKISLDIFGGSGALSIEGLSRGIKHCYINDASKEALNIIKQNLKNIDVLEYDLFNYDYKQLLDHIRMANIKIDLIYLDPPFARLDYYYDVFNFICQNQILNNYGIVITESEHKLDLEKINFLTLLKYKDYKNKHLYFFRLE